MAQIAASIEYEAARPPDGLPDDMEPLPGASLQFLSIKATGSKSRLRSGNLPRRTNVKLACGKQSFRNA
jgi:hypothetical protein